MSEEAWCLCVALLTAKGMKETTARALIGRQAKEWEESDVVAAYEKASGKADPRAYAAGILQRIKKKARKAQDQLPLMPAEPPAPVENARAVIARTRALLRGQPTSGTKADGS